MDHGCPCSLIFFDLIGVPEKPIQQEILLNQRGIRLHLPNVVMKYNFAPSPDTWTKGRRPRIEQVSVIAVLVRGQLHVRVIPMVIGEEITYTKHWILPLREQFRFAVSSSID